MENTIENKANFFALHWGQFVASKDIFDKILVNPLLVGVNIEEYVLELKSVYEITDEDAIEVANLLGWTEHEKSIKIKQCNSFLKGGFDFTNCTFIADYLRSKGYAVSFMGVSVKTLIEWGWVKLKNE